MVDFKSENMVHKLKESKPQNLNSKKTFEGDWSMANKMECR